jgi:hypothetical protein
LSALAPPSEIEASRQPPARLPLSQTTLRRARGEEKGPSGDLPMASLAAIYAALNPLIGPTHLVLGCLTAWLRYYKPLPLRRRTSVFKWQRTVFLWGAFEKETLELPTSRSSTVSVSHRRGRIKAEQNRSEILSRGEKVKHSRARV